MAGARPYSPLRVSPARARLRGRARVRNPPPLLLHPHTGGATALLSGPLRSTASTVYTVVLDDRALCCCAHSMPAVPAPISCLAVTTWGGVVTKQSDSVCTLHTVHSRPGQPHRAASRVVVMNTSGRGCPLAGGRDSRRGGCPLAPPHTTMCAPHLSSRLVPRRVLHDNEKELLVWCDHDLVLLGPHAQEAQVVLRAHGGGGF